jgi:hypothetical protein
MSLFKIPLLNLEADRYRIQARQRDKKDTICSKTLKWALHLSQGEYDSLESLNPDTLGHEDEKIRKNYWKKFIESHESDIFKIRRNI